MKLFSLTYNELVKQFKKPSIKLLSILILVAAIIFPVAIKNIPENRYYKNLMENNKFLLQDAQSYLESLKDDKTQKGKIKFEYARINVETRKLYVDNEVGYRDWREKESENYRNVSSNLAAIEFVLEGYEKDIVLENLQDNDSNEVEKYFNMTLAKKKEIEANFIAEKEKIKNIILNNDYIAHTQEEINRTNSQIAQLNSCISEYEKLMKKNPTDEAGKSKLLELEKKSKNAKIKIPQLQQDMEVMKFRFNNKIDYDLNNWKNNSIQQIENELIELRYPMLDEKQYSSQAVFEGIEMTYDEYVKNFNKKREVTINEIKELWYGLENNIPGLNQIKDARSVLDGGYEIFVVLAVIIVIIIGGGIVATEYSKGTIRLLLIRPVSRWKILLSKLLAVLIVGIGVVFIGIATLYISTGVVFGFETYKTPLLDTISGSIVHLSYIKFLLSKIMISCSSLVFIATLVFLISTVAKNTALAVAISMMLYLGAVPATDMLISLKQTWIISTFIPYINVSYLRLIPSTQQMLSQSFGMQLEYTQGAIQLILISIVMLLITFITFIRRDVKN
ncbi:ABC transporter permease subunit [Clostridium ihumii]|uniref:ABC transporter permease subunit n=1 Tax=Clostridium ihumii TaxID=1470356 RepID=UPI0005900F6B|nr:ABC transporter permease subunit [Clostridium ihumii]